MSDLFRRLAHRTSVIVGGPFSFALALLLIVGWLITGPLFNFSDTWQLVINTGTTIITFLMVFLIQNTQNRDSKAIQLKLDELVYHVKGARNNLIDIEDMPDDELHELEQGFHRQREEFLRHTEQQLARIQRRHKH